MGTSKFAWNMAVRGAGLTAGVGALLGAGYGIVLLATMILSLGQYGPDSGVLPVALVILYSILLAALFGAVVAGVIGAVAGPIGGLLCAAMTRLFFSPAPDWRMYRQVASICAFIYGILAIVVAVRWISTSTLAPPIETTRQALMLYVLPGLLGGLAGIYISRRVTDAYRVDTERQSGAGGAEPVGAIRRA